MGEVFRARSFWIPGLAILPMSLAFGAVQYNLGVLSRDLGLATDAAANLIALHALCMILGKFVFGGLGDRMDHRYLFWIAAGLMAFALYVLQGETRVGMFVTGVVMMGLSGGGMLPFMGMMYGSRFGVASFSRVMGFAMLPMMAGSLGPLMAGWAFDVTGSYSLAFQGFMVLMVPAAVAMTWLPKPDLGIGQHPQARHGHDGPL
jgi:MFS family permease